MERNNSNKKEVFQDVSEPNWDEDSIYHELQEEMVEEVEEIDVLEPDYMDESLFPSYHRGRQPTKVMDATQIYLSEIGFSPLLSAEEEVYYAKLALKGEEAARKKMIESNLRLVVKISRRYLNRGLPLLD